MKKAGYAVTNYLCSHFKKSRQELFLIVKIKHLKTFRAVMTQAGDNPESLGCEICKPAIASILASLVNEFVMADQHHQLQDTNDKYLANIQRNGTYSVVPRIVAGEIVGSQLNESMSCLLTAICQKTPAKLKVIATVGEKYGLYTKITGG
jgi:nitrite reductase (NAD(P)H)